MLHVIISRCRPKKDTLDIVRTFQASILMKTASTLPFAGKCNWNEREKVGAIDAARSSNALTISRFHSKRETARSQILMELLAASRGEVEAQSSSPSGSKESPPKQGLDKLVCGEYGFWVGKRILNNFVLNRKSKRRGPNLYF